MLASKLRAVFSEEGLSGAATLTAAFGCYRLDLPEGTWVDVLAAASAAYEAESLLAANKPEPAIEAAVLAESITRQPFLPGDDGSWVTAKRRELEDVRVRALTVLADASLRLGKPEEAVRWAELAVEAEQFRESGYRLLMMAHIAGGNRAEALRVYERCRQFLADELGAYPSPETEAVYRELLETRAPAEDDRDGPLEPPQTMASEAHRRRPRARLLVALVVAAVAAAVFALDNSGGATRLMPDSVIRVDPHTLRMTQVARVGDAPDLIVAAGGYLWVTNWILRDGSLPTQRAAGDLALWRVDPSTGQARTVNGGVSPCGIAPDPSGDVWVANCFSADARQASNVVLVDHKTEKFRKTILLPGGGVGSYFRGMTYGGGYLWVADSPWSGSRTVWRIGPGPHFSTRAIPVADPGKTLGALAWSNDGELWSTAFSDGTLTRFDVATRKTKTLGTLTHPVANQPVSLAAYGHTMWVAEWGAPDILRLDTIGVPHPRSVPLHVRNRRACVSISCVWTVAAGAGAIWATTARDRALWKIDPRNDQVTRISLPYMPTGVTVWDGQVWVTVRGR